MTVEQETAHPAPAVELEGRIVQLIAHARQTHGHKALHVDADLRGCARDRAHTMLHDNALGKHPAPLQFILKRTHAHHAGEAVAWGSGTLGSADALVKSLIDDPHERATLLDARFTRVGVGAAIGTFQGHAHSHVVAIELVD